MSTDAPLTERATHNLPASPWNSHTEHLPAPLAVVDLDAFDANAADLRRRAGGTPIRVATKSVRVPELIRRTLGMEGFAGVMTFTLAEAMWLVEQGITADALMGYPTVDRAALGELAARSELREQVTLMVDSLAHLGNVSGAFDADDMRVLHRMHTRTTVRVDEVHARSLDVDERPTRAGPGPHLSQFLIGRCV